MIYLHRSQKVSKHGHDRSLEDLMVLDQHVRFPFRESLLVRGRSARNISKYGLLQAIVGHSDFQQR